MSVTAEMEAADRLRGQANGVRDGGVRRILRSLADLHQRRAEEIAVGEYRLVVIGSDNWPEGDPRRDLESQLRTAASGGYRRLTVVSDIGSVGVAGNVHRWCEEKYWLGPARGIQVASELAPPREETEAAEQCRLIRLAEQRRPDRVLLYSRGQDWRVVLAAKVFGGKNVSVLWRTWDDTRSPAGGNDIPLL